MDEIPLSDLPAGGRRLSRRRNSKKRGEVMERRIAVVGSAQTKYARRLADKHYGEMIYHTVNEALADAGMKIADIDTVVGAGCDVLDGRSISNVFVAEASGAFLKEETKVEADGAFAAVYTCMRMLSGAFDTALIVSYSKSSESHPHYYSGLMFEPILLRPMGLDGLTSSALQANRYMSRFGVTEEQCAAAAVKNRRNGMKNPLAQIRKEHSVEDVMRSEALATPIKKLDACPITDGVCVVVMAADGKARAAARPAWIKGFSHCMDAYNLGHRDLSELPALKKAAEEAYRMAGVTDPLAQLDAAEISEAFSYQELMIYEALGFCGPGEGGAFMDGGATQPGGRLPVNPSGGLLCANPIIAAGLARVAEAAMQVTGSAGERQVAGAKLALAHGTSGPCLQANAVLILGAEKA